MYIGGEKYDEFYDNDNLFKFSGKSKRILVSLRVK